ncbi:glycerophosphodiester phosphodiesterase family protein [Candidiatus Paracoxiella cheracis]|uniref:glycerophosphodiester phosphodiesterase family protein n=1 Tax=Candidiatus Paracoxiella cheracis TaxID=3405120 RepID=UPI003BF51194
MVFILPKVIAHRGAPLVAPENTLASLRAAKSLGATWVEFDVQLTHDGKAIIFHDDELDRTTNGKGLVAALSYDLISELDAGSWFNKKFKNERIPTLTDYLQCAAQLGLGINVELKGTASQSEALARCVATALQSYWPKHLPVPLISSALPACLQSMKAITDEYPQGFIMHEWADSWRDTVDELGCVSLHVEYEQLNPKRAEAVKLAEKKLLAYTINDATVAKSLFDIGVDSVFSDNPELLEQTFY